MEMPLRAAGILERLFSQDRFADFISQHFLQTPFASVGGCSSLVSLGSWDVLAAILANGNADVIVGAGATQSDAPVPRSLDEARAALEAGWTIGVRHAERCHAELEPLAQCFRETFRSEVDVQLYCTPGGHGGFGWHYDAEDVFVLQTVGQKTWSLRKNTINPWPLIEALPNDMHYEREIMPVMRCPLEAGDWLYVPGGYWHRTEAADTSISLSVGILPATAIDLLDFVRRELPRSLLWRQRLPLDPSGDAGKADYIAITTSLACDMAKHLTDPRVIAAFLAARPQ